MTPKPDVFVTTHYMDEAEHCHRLAFIQDGKTIAYGDPQEIKHKTIQEDLIKIAPSNPTKAVEYLRKAKEDGSLNIEGVELYGSFVHVFGRGLRKSSKKIIGYLTRKGIPIKN